MKTDDKIINASSQDFPMKTFYGNISPEQIRRDRPCIKLFPDLRNGFNNESPDFFRMDSMKENMTGYKNPYLNVVKTLDRSLFYKNNQSCIEHINMINKIKSKKELSQNPKIIRQLCYSTDINKLENKLHKESKITPYLFKTISSDFNNNEYSNKIKSLNGEYSPNHHYLLKNSFNIKKIHENQFANTQNIFNGKNNQENSNSDKLSFNTCYEKNKFNETKAKINSYNVDINDTERAIEKSQSFMKAGQLNNLNLKSYKNQENSLNKSKEDFYDQDFNGNSLGLKQMISPKQSSVLRNINDYHIKEFTARDETRMFSFPKKDVNIYNCVTDKTIKVTPSNYTFDKWGKFHENYVMMMDQEKPFNIKAELFTEYSEKNRYLLDLIRQERKKLLAEKKKSMASTVISFNDANPKIKSKHLSTSLKKLSTVPSYNNLSDKLEIKNSQKAKFNIKSGVF